MTPLLALRSPAVLIKQLQPAFPADIRRKGVDYFKARRVSVVGDFNSWDTDADAMSRDPATGLWSRTLALRPGRHVYAFVVDDSVWMRDPRSPAAEDKDFGRPGSVLLVGQP